MPRTTPKGTRPPSTKQHRLLRSSRAEMKHMMPGVDLPEGQEVWRCSCANPPVWTGSRQQAEGQHGEHVAAQNPEKPHPEDDIVEEPDGTITVRYGFAARGGQPAHRGQITYASKDEYEASADSGLHDKHRLVRWYGALASNRGEQTGEILEETPHPPDALGGIHWADDPANRVEAQPPPGPLRRRFLDPDNNVTVVLESTDGGATWQIAEGTGDGTE